MKKIREVLEFEVDSHSRLDTFLAKVCPELSRSYIKKLIEQGFVSIAGERKKPSYRVKPGDKVRIEIPEAKPLEIKPEDIPIDVVYEDEDVLVLIKPCGLVVHPSPGHIGGTLVNALLHHTENLSSIGGVERPGIVHRLDKETMGLMVVAKNDTAHRSLSEQFSQRKTEKLYKAIVVGIPEKEHAVIDMRVGRHPVERKKFSVRSPYGKPAKSEFWVLEKFPKLNLSLLRVKIYTGRTHQIRVHLSALGHPVVGDRTYGFKSSKVPEEVRKLLKGCNMLLSYRLGFLHPSRGEWLSFEIQEVSPFKEVLERIRELERSLG